MALRVRLIVIVAAALLAFAGRPARSIRRAAPLAEPVWSKSRVYSRPSIALTGRAAKSASTGKAIAAESP